jgi:outer membrane protein
VKRLVALSLGAIALGSGGSAAQVPDTLTLAAAIQTALDRHPDAVRARARLDAAAADQRAGWGAFLPQADASLFFQRSEFTTVTFPSPEGPSQRLDEPLEDVSKGANQSLSFSWDLLRGGQRFTDMRRTRAATRSANNQVSQTERDITATVQVAYYEALKQAGLVDVARQQLDGRRRDLEVARRRYEIAAVNRTDVLGAEIEVGQAEIALVEAIDAEASAQRELRFSMGLSTDGPGFALREVGAPPDATRLDESELAGVALSTKPEIRALEADVVAASAGVWGARSRYLPNISLSYNLGRSEQGGVDAPFFQFGPDNTSQTFSIQASWSLFDGFTREQQTAQARADLRTAESSLSLQRITVERDVRNLVREIQTGARRLELQERNRDLARQRVEMMRERYRLGTVEYTDLLTATQQLTEAERALIQERYEFLKSWASLEAEVGGVF